ncbi:Nuclear envelope morphology protein 1 [Mortierella claussenii]|nr:Nuclear envelope morphology protein 1 [Mortierella claussenii]
MNTHSTTSATASTLSSTGSAISIMSSASLFSGGATPTAAAAAAAATIAVPSTTFQKATPAAASSSSSLSVALCRSLVLKYIYLTYLFLLQLLVWPSAAVKTFLKRRHSPQAAGAGAGAMVGAVGQEFLQQYTLDNHLGHYHNSSTATPSGNNHSNSHGNNINNNNNNNNNNSSSSNINYQNGNSMLRRSSRFKSRSDLEEIAQSSTSSSPLLQATAVTGTLSSTSSSFSKCSSGMEGSRSSLGSIAAGYGTDSMAEDGGSGDNNINNNNLTMRGNSIRLRQRMSRPMSGLGMPHGHGYGGIGARKKTLVLDLDETLIHSTSRGSRSQGYMVEVLVDRHACLYYVYKRPHVDYFLKKVAEWYKLVIFTASMAEYADPVIDWLDQNRTLFEKRYFRQACFFRNGSYLKDLTVIDQDLSSVCLLDNSPISYSLNKENGIPIDSWIDDPNDEALLDLLPFLDALRFTEDVRSVLSLRTV